jgi:enterochelin esterase-like enzyme
MRQLLRSRARRYGVLPPAEVSTRAGRRRWRLGLGVLPVLLGMVISVSVANAAAPRSLGSHSPASLAPEVVHTGTAPTGYTVTFRIYDPTATLMLIKGEWSFASAADILTDPTNANAVTGNNWQAGDFPLASPNAGPAANWPVTDMTKDAASGVWSYTTALPSGVFSYQFYPDCDAAAPALTGCTPIVDPSNPPWNSSGSIELTSQVYVPSDPRFGTVDNSWQGPTTAREEGQLTHVTYSSPGHVDPAGVNYAVVYTPPGYNPRRAPAYPTFYLIHGGGGNEMDWTTQGDLKNIMDNLIAERQVEPMIVVMPNNPTSTDVTDNLIPFVQQNYDAQADASGRSFAGLSGGASPVEEVLYSAEITTFGYYAVWSAPTGAPSATQAANPQLKQLLGLAVGDGIQDLGGRAHGNTTLEEAVLTAAGVPFVSYNVNGGHNWAYWRDALRDFLTAVDFRTTSVSVSDRGGAVSATVKSATTEPAVLAGVVEFALNGRTLGRPVPLRNGEARIRVPRWLRQGVITARYSGDTLYNPSTGEGAL